MESCQPGRESAPASRPFQVVAYAPDDSGRWAPVAIPTNCPMGARAAECHIGIDHHRARKTGPRVPVVVVACSTHKCRFTLYPCGHVPYGREAVAPVGLDGLALSTATAGGGAEEPCAPWRQTRFGAVLDAARGKAWPRDGPDLYWPTQLRRLDELAALLGLDPTPCAALGEKFAELLDLPSVPASSRWVAKQCLSECGVKRLVMPASIAANRKARCTDDSLIGLPGWLPGNRNGRGGRTRA
jgi:hypothetical protein